MFKQFAIAVALFAAAVQGFAQEPPRFNRDVRPILSDTCYACHGPDANTRKAGLRLDTAEGALAEGAVVPGDAAASELVRRIISTDPDERMPPPESELSLTAEQIDTLTRWVAAGAAYEPHWSLVPPAASVPPATVADPGGWVRDPIDTFVLQRLETEGLTPSPEADRETLLRRVSLDLTGLPPTIEEMDAFLADTAPDAYEKAVDRLLASPAYGERMAVDWMDVARYADTFGYQSDVEMDVWPWRDWVIKAFNENLPYDDFMKWQLAGDLLPNATQEQRLATTFNRLHRQTNEGGSINEEFRVSYVSDRAETAATAFMGLTFGCAKCHDHKFDPISQRDYFSLSSFFANIDESGLYSHYTRTPPTPSMFLYGEREEERHAMLKRKVERLVDAVTKSEREAVAGFDAWLANPEREQADPALVVSLPFDEATDGRTPNAAKPDQVASFIGQPPLTAGVRGQALAFDGDNGAQVDGVAAFERSDPFTVTFWIKVEKHIPKAVVLHRCLAESDAASRGYEVMLDEGRPVFSLIHFWPGNAIRIRANEAIPENTWVHVAARYDGSSRAAGATLYINGAAAPVEVVRDNLYKTIEYEGNSKVPFSLAQRSRDNGLKGGALDEVQVYAAALSELEIGAIAGLGTVGEKIAALVTQGDEAARSQLAAHYALRIAPEALEDRVKLQEARRKESDFVGKLRSVMVMEELPVPKQTYVLARGEYDKPTEPVAPDTPKALPPFPQDQPRNRLGLANWLTDANHPLTARVAVNRYWQLFFGRGLVETAEDFGSQGKAPSHPELLDHLARGFVDSGWDVKALSRRMVLSATYRQESKAGADLRGRDPFNVLLARGPLFRLGAEQIRDQALAASGLLARTVGGPSVKPY